jgi:adenine-specific DNA-methyltransferase
MAYRYIGNKTALLAHLVDAVERRLPHGGLVADLMCGTASVAEALRVAGYTVVASDLMTYAVHHARVRLLLDRAPRFTRLGAGPYAAILQELENLEGASGLFVQEYSDAGSPAAGCPPRRYFTSENAARIDAIRARLSEWENGGLLTIRERSLLRHDLIMAVNDVANIAGTYGHFRSSWSNNALRPLQLVPTRFIRGPSVKHTVLQGAAEEVAQVSRADLCYLDPPYMKRQYAANYHIIETLARGDEPDAIGISGLRDWWDQYSAFCSKRQIQDAFSTIIGKMECPRFLISYSEDGLVPVGSLTSFFETFGRVELSSIPHKRFRSNDSALGSTVTEYLIYVEVER